MSPDAVALIQAPRARTPHGTATQPPGPAAGGTPFAELLPAAGAAPTGPEPAARADAKRPGAARPNRAGVDAAPASERPGGTTTVDADAGPATAQARSQAGEAATAGLHPRSRPGDPAHGAARARSHAPARRDGPAPAREPGTDSASGDGMASVDDAVSATATPDAALPRRTREAVDPTDPAPARTAEGITTVPEGAVPAKPSSHPVETAATGTATDADAPAAAAIRHDARRHGDTPRSSAPAPGVEADARSPRETGLARDGVDGQPGAVTDGAAASRATRGPDTAPATGAAAIQAAGAALAGEVTPSEPAAGPATGRSGPSRSATAPAGSATRSTRGAPGEHAALAAAETAAPRSPADLLETARAVGERLRQAVGDRPAEGTPGAAAAAPSSFLPVAPATHGVAASAQEAPPAAPSGSYPITVPLTDPRFGDAFSERVTWLVREGLQSAELTLNPADLGPIRIELSLDGDAASIGVQATHAETRGAIEQALPRLREMLADEGLRLGGAMVDAGAGRGRDDGARHRGGRTGDRIATAGSIGSSDPSAVAMPGGGLPRTPRAGRIDLFA